MTAVDNRLDIGPAPRPGGRTDAFDTPQTRAPHPWSVWISAAALALIVGYAVLAPLLAPAAAHSVDLLASRQGPSAEHWFGTDQSGRDLFVRVAQGLRVSLAIAVACSLLSTLIGLVVGTVAAVFSGWVDAVLMRFADALNALPHLLLGVVILAFFPGSVVAIVLSIALTHWAQVARIVRSEALTARSMEYVEAAYLAGATRWEVARRHLVPAALGQALVAIVLLTPHAIWHESTLSFLGLGLAPDRASLGTLLAISRGEILIGNWWMLVFPAVLLVVASLAVAGVARAAQTKWAPLSDRNVT